MTYNDTTLRPLTRHLRPFDPPGQQGDDRNASARREDRVSREKEEAAVKHWPIQFRTARRGVPGAQAHHEGVQRPVESQNRARRGEGRWDRQQRGIPSARMSELCQGQQDP